MTCLSVTCIHVLARLLGALKSDVPVKKEIQNLDDGYVVFPVAKLFLPCNSDILADCRVIRYKILMTTLIRETKYVI